MKITENDIALIMNKVNDALKDTDYIAVGYDNNVFLSVLIDKAVEEEEDVY